MPAKPQDRVPPIPRELVEYLERVIRPRLPGDPAFTLQEVAFAAGQQQVINHLRHHLDRQEKGAVPPNP